MESFRLHQGNFGHGITALHHLFKKTKKNGATTVALSGDRLRLSELSPLLAAVTSSFTAAWVPRRGNVLARLVVADDLTALSSLLSPVACSRRSLHFLSMHTVHSDPLSSLLSHPFPLLRHDPQPPALSCRFTHSIDASRSSSTLPRSFPASSRQSLCLSCSLRDLPHLSIRPSLTQSQLDIGRMLVACCHCSSFTCGWVCMKCAFGTSAENQISVAVHQAFASPTVLQF